ncbi:hypothetical protein ACFE04_018993 [Oxalis oulophora]
MIIDLSAVDFYRCALVGLSAKMASADQERFNNLIESTMMNNINWQNLNTPCLWDHINIAAHLAFLTIFFIYFILISVSRICPTDVTNHAKDNLYAAQRSKLSISYKASIPSSTLLLASHFLLLLLLFNGDQIYYCTSPFQAFTSQIMQVLSSLVTLIAVCRILTQKNCVKLPWLLRAWWICSFMLSVVCTYLHIISYEKFKVRSYADFLCLLASTFLLGISIHGKTGFVSICSNVITDALLTEKTDKTTTSESPYGNASPFQLITFSWLNPLFAAGIKKPLEQDDIPNVDFRESAEFVSPSFIDCVNRVKECDGEANPSIYKAIYLFIWKKAAINIILAVISAAISYVGPYLIHDFVDFLAQKKNRKLQKGYLLALAFLGAKIIETTAQRQWIFGARKLGLRLKAALNSHIYKKGLVLSSRSRQSHTNGEIINYMSVDIQRMSDFIWYINTIWMLPVQISLAIYVLYTNIGLASFVALAATLIVMACNIPITRFQKKYQSMIMEAKDDRMKATSEILRNIKAIKLQAWDNHFLRKILNIRENEHNWLWKSLRLSAISSFVFWGSPTFISVLTFGACVLLGIELTAGRVLSALATFRMLQDPIFSLPDLLSVIAQSKVSADRVTSFLQEEEIQQDAIEYVPKDQTEFDIDIENGTFNWNPESEIPNLDGINLKIKRGMKVAICGTVGSGKSSLLSSILGEIQKSSGSVKICGSKAYVPQSPWILTGDIRENILFGNPYQSAKYDRTVKACALIKDFELFSNGDLTEIGERGINMSGGQKQRIQIARAIYQDADIYLLDDPFSAVDAHTGTQLFQDCLMGMLQEKTVLYVTHQVEFLPAADLILVMQNGKITQAGQFDEILKQNIGFELLVGAHNQALESILTVKNSSITSEESITDSETQPSTSNVETRQNSESNQRIVKAKNRGKLVQEEERESGSIGKETYWKYLTVFKGGALVPVIIIVLSSFQVLQIASNYWMAWASPTTSNDKSAFGMNVILLVYSLLALTSSFCVLVRAMLVVTIGLWTAQTLFTNMLQSILRAPMSFFDSTPTGRILNRVSTDQSVIDLETAVRLNHCANNIINLLGIVAVMSQVSWEVFLIFIPVTAICIWYQRYYIPTSRELARLAGIQRAPILHHFSESLAGAATIRAFDQGARFMDANHKLIDNHSRPWFHNVAAMEWLSFRLNILSNFVFASSLVILVILPEGVINPSIAGLAVTYGINLNVLQSQVIWNICNAENKMISVERVLQYSNLPSEAPLVIEDSRPPSNWPEIGTICFRNLEIRYAEHLPSILKNISCTFPGRKKVGVVGRTGSGKSTLIQAIFRVVDPREGSIIIDDVDISKIGLYDLRSRLSIIPQDPSMFEGTVRGNLDPLMQYSDNEVWQALEKCQLGNLVRDKEEKLDATVVESGENWSVGQRQLFCLGRALLKKSNILVLDEATASVDSATDGVVQKVISQEFKDQTVVTIAHRIHTIIDSDLVLVLSDGRVAEFDAPGKLLERENSFFSKLIKECSMRSQKNF